MITFSITAERFPRGYRIVGTLEGVTVDTPVLSGNGFADAQWRDAIRIAFSNRLWNTAKIADCHHRVMAY